MAGQFFREFDVHHRTDDLNNLAFIHVARSSRYIVAELAAGNFQQLLGDIALAQFVVFEGQVLDQVGGVVRGVLHRHHAGALFAGLGLQQDPVDVNVEVVPEEIPEHRLRTGLKEDLGRVGGQVRFGFRAGNLQSLDFADRQKLHRNGFLGQRVDEPRRDNLDLIHFAFQKQVAGKAGNRPRFGETRRVREGKLRGQLPAGARDELRRPLARP